MSNFKTFKEFAEEKGFDKNGLIPNQDIPKPNKLPQLLNMKDSIVGKDYNGNLSTKPVKASDPLPYKGYNTMDKDKTGKGILVYDDDSKPGLASKGNNILTPKNSGGEAPKTDIQKVKPKHKLTSEEFINETRDMSPAEFLDFFTEGNDEPLPTVTDLYGNQFTPDPTQTIQYMAALMVKNPRLMSRFIREVKNYDSGMNQIMNESFNHPEFYSVLADGMAEPEEGRKRCHKIARAMNDQYMGALENFMIEQRLNEEVVSKKDLAFEDGGPIGDEPENPSGIHQDDDDTQPSTEEPGMPNSAPDSLPPGQGMDGPPPMPPTGLDMGNGAPKKKPSIKMKGDTAHGNMIEEMGSYPHMYENMKSHCSGKNCPK